MIENILSLLIMVIPIILAITLHECAHGYVAKLCGDPTAQLYGRLTLNPIKHIAPFGTIILPFALNLMGAPMFGYAKPVPIDYRYFKHIRLHTILVTGAGPLMNIFLAILSLNILILLNIFSPSPSQIINEICILSFKINIWFALFNMIPIPPLDGGRILMVIFNKHQAWSNRIDLIGSFIILCLLFLVPLLSENFLGYPLRPLSFLEPFAASLERSISHFHF